jgi:hypothetical protein
VSEEESPFLAYRITSRRLSGGCSTILRRCVGIYCSITPVVLARTSDEFIASEDIPEKHTIQQMIKRTIREVESSLSSKQREIRGTCCNERGETSVL